MIKALKKLGNKETYSNIIKTVSHKLIVSSILNRENLKAFVQKSRIETCSFSPFSYNMVLEARNKK